MKYGIKLPVDTLIGERSDVSEKIAASFGGTDGLLPYYGEVLDAVELANVTVKTSGDALLAACRTCAQFGLSVTVHGSLNGADTAEAFFAPYLPLFASALQPLYTVTVHPLTDPDENGHMLRAICECIRENGYPVRLMLENQRDKEGKYPHTRWRGVAETVRAINSPYLGMCFDFGHQLSNLRMHDADFDGVAVGAFGLIGHTHIHAASGTETHFPLGGGETLLEENLTPLVRLGYDGVLLLELLPARYMDKFDIKDSITSSVSILKTAVEQVQTKEAAAAEYRDRFATHTEHVRSALSENTRVMGVVGTSAYVIRLGNTRLAIDPSLWALPVNEDGRAALLSLLGTCDAIVITHAHGDHFDKELLCGVPHDIPIYLPDFLTYERENVIYTESGKSYAVGDVALHIFESEHSEVLPDGRLSTVPEYGFAVGYEGACYVFPTDVRTYEKAHAVFPETKMLIAHLWLGRGAALNVHANGYVERFCRYAESFGAEKIYLSHMFDVRREIEAMWNGVHADLVAARLENCAVLRLGDCIEL